MGRKYSNHRSILRVLSAVAVLFGLLTLKEGGSVIFDIGVARRDAGNYVPAVVWFNFLSGFAYIAAGCGLWMRKQWGVLLSGILAISIILSYSAFVIHIVRGGHYEMRTVFAMALRTFFWLMISVVSYRKLGCKFMP